MKTWYDKYALTVDPKSPLNSSMSKRISLNNFIFRKLTVLTSSQYEWSKLM